MRAEAWWLALCKCMAWRVRCSFVETWAPSRLVVVVEVKNFDGRQRRKQTPFQTEEGILGEERMAIIAESWRCCRRVLGLCLPCSLEWFCVCLFAIL